MSPGWNVSFVASSFSMDLVFVAARNSGGVRNWIWRVIGAECDGGGKRISPSDKPAAAA